MFKYNKGSDIPKLMKSIGIPNTKDGATEIAATLGFTDVYMRQVIDSDKELKKSLKWALWGVERYVTDEEQR